MPYNIIKETNGNYKKFFGHLTGTEFLQSVFENHSDPEFERLRYTINDLLEIESHSVTESSLEIAVAHGLRVAQSNPLRKIAVVTDDPLIQHHVSAHSTSGEQRLEVFKSLHDARSWVESL